MHPARPARFLVAIPLLLSVLLAGCSTDEAPPPLPAELACQAGAWRMDSGELLALSPVTGGLRYRLIDGRSGVFAPPGSGAVFTAREGWRDEDSPPVATATFEPCPAGRMQFALEGGPSGGARRIALEAHDTSFRSGDVTLRGRLVLPEGAAGPVPLAVLLHGSEDYSAVDIYPTQYLLPAQGVAVLVYDKRGTGGSEGEYTQDFHVLADDAVAALGEARRLRPAGFSRAGFVGGSQGGWIAPLAASKVDVDYVAALFGMAEGALAEDREQVMDDLRAAGHGPEVLERAREITDATARVMASGFTEGYEQLAAVQEVYGDEPWFADIQGEFSGRVLEIPSWSPQWLVRSIAMRSVQGTSWDYEPLPVLAALEVPQLWVIAAEDREAPNVETLRRLRALQAQGRPVDLVVFPGTDHGIYQFVEEDGERVMLRHPEGYLRLLAEWIAEPELRGPYGDALVEPRRDGPPSS
ncbi:alpha/beta fold hydrolase [Luteimonas sp. RD2P54]|uniref:Alpha/beta fold hydrolase n=1 Tax=Luteimonas endophytica TaxID=3042023 RepID=A0ABT6JA76_9GAMM|nr:alpha/beta fold hydrolase [Luteimonas endophytica]MDH5823492.1 alpha/beta fold hydrolase [Luteimonas endophytica]